MKKRKRALALLCAAMMIGVSCKRDPNNDVPNSSGQNSDTLVSVGSDSGTEISSGPTGDKTVIQSTDPFFDIVDMQLELPGSDGKTIASIDIDRDNIQFVGNTISLTQCYIEYEVPQNVRSRMKQLESNGEIEELQKLQAEYSKHFNAVFDLNGKLLRHTQSVFQENILTSFEDPNGETFAIVADDDQVFLEKMQPDGSLEKIRTLGAAYIQNAVMMPDGTLVCATFDEIGRAHV